MPLKVIIPKSVALDPKRLLRAIENGLDGAAKNVLIDFKVTVQTWQQKPDFAISESPGERTIGTDDEIYGYVNDGTRAHLIVAKTAAGLAFGSQFTPKTSVRVIGSSAGSRGGPLRRPKAVRHPGTEAREFDEVIAEKWRDLFPVIMQRAIDAEVT